MSLLRVYSDSALLPKDSRNTQVRSMNTEGRCCLNDNIWQADELRFSPALRFSAWLCGVLSKHVGSVFTDLAELSTCA